MTGAPFASPSPGDSSAGRQPADESASRPVAGAEPVTILVCTTCRRAEEPGEPKSERSGARLHRALAEAAAGGPHRIVGVECLSVCKRPVTVGFAAPGKWTYVYGDFQDASAEAAGRILAAAAQYAAAPDGLIPWRERPDALKKGVVARVPPLTPASEAAE